MFKRNEYILFIFLIVYKPGKPVSSLIISLNTITISHVTPLISQYIHIKSTGTEKIFKETGERCLGI